MKKLLIAAIIAMIPLPVMAEDVQLDNVIRESETERVEIVDKLATAQCNILVNANLVPNKTSSNGSQFKACYRFFFDWLIQWENAKVSEEETTFQEYTNEEMCRALVKGNAVSQDKLDACVLFGDKRNAQSTCEFQAGPFWTKKDIADCVEAKLKAKNRK